MRQIYFLSAPKNGLRRYPKRAFYLRFQPSAFRSLSRGPGRPLRTLDSGRSFSVTSTRLHKLIFLSFQNRLAGRQWGAGKPPAQRTFPLSCTLPRESRLLLTSSPQITGCCWVGFFFLFERGGGGGGEGCYRVFTKNLFQNNLRMTGFIVFILSLLHCGDFLSVLLQTGCDLFS